MLVYTNEHIFQILLKFCKRWFCYGSVENMAHNLKDIIKVQTKVKLKFLSTSIFRRVE
jgi:hypothetical protein